jgi:bifunctional non-homologous end joining protein LigD
MAASRKPRPSWFAFDLLELGGKDLRRTPLEERKGALAKLVRKASWAVQLNEHIAERGDIVFHHACKLGFEGIVSKRLGSPYVSGRSRHWVKSKHPGGPARVGGGLGEKGMAITSNFTCRPQRGASDVFWRVVL